MRTCQHKHPKACVSFPRFLVNSLLFLIVLTLIYNLVCVVGESERQGVEAKEGILIGESAD